MNNNFKISSKASKQKVGGLKLTKVTIEGDLTILNAIAVKKELLSLLNKNDSLELDCKSIQQIDLSGIQLLLALKQSALSLNKTIKLECNLPEDISKIIKNSGFDLNKF